jgi:hypothetical protein
MIRIAHALSLIQIESANLNLVRRIALRASRARNTQASALLHQYGAIQISYLTWRRGGIRKSRQSRPQEKIVTLLRLLREIVARHLRLNTVGPSPRDGALVVDSQPDFLTSTSRLGPSSSVAKQYRTRHFDWIEALFQEPTRLGRIPKGYDSGGIASRMALVSSAKILRL